MTLLAALIIVAAGFLAGMVGSLFGLGGGILIVPVLVVGFDLPMHHAVATSLLCVIATSSAAASRYVRIGVANVRLGVTLETMTVIGAILGGSLAGRLPERTLMLIFAVTVLAMSLLMARSRDSESIELEPPHEEEPGFRALLAGRYRDAALGRDVRYGVRRLPVALGVSGFAGVLSGLLGIGGGILKVPALTLLSGVPMKAAAATSNLMIGVTAAASAVLYYGRGEISPFVSAASVIGVFVGSRSGAKIAGRIRGDALRKAFAVVMVLMAAQLLVKAYGVDLY